MVVDAGSALGHIIVKETLSDVYTATLVIENLSSKNDLDAPTDENTLA